MNSRDSAAHELNPMSLMTLLLSFISLAIVTSLLFLPETEHLYQLFLTIDTLICGIFWSQLLTDLYRSQRRIAYLKQHWVDFVASIPVIQEIRFMRIVQVFRVLRLLNSSHQILSQLRANRKETTVASIILLLALLVTIGSSLMLRFESGTPGASIQTADDAIWWVFVTISTVGYGDYYPVTTMGKLLATVIIICGVGLFGMVAGLVSAIVSGEHKMKPKEQAKKQEETAKSKAETSSNVPTQDEWQQMLSLQRQLLARIEQLESKISNNKLSSNTLSDNKSRKP